MEDGTKIPVVQSKPEGFDDKKVPFEITDILQKWYDRDYGFNEVIEPEVLEHDWNFRISSIKTEQIWTDWNEIPNPTNYDRIEVQVREQGQSLWNINGTNTTDDADDITVGLSKDMDYEMRLVLFNSTDDEVSASNILTFTTGGAVVEPEPEPTPDPKPIPEPEPTPDPEPDKPIETDEEALDMAQKILDFLKKKSSLIVIGVIAVIILLIILL